jgi:hypothetical protein
MTRRNSTFKQGDITRVLRAAAKGGFQAGRVEVAQDGRIVLIADKKEPARNEGEANEWDRV